jgi:hypothetical protein
VPSTVVKTLCPLDNNDEKLPIEPVIPPLAEIGPFVIDKLLNIQVGPEIAPVKVAPDNEA